MGAVKQISRKKEDMSVDTLHSGAYLALVLVIITHSVDTMAHPIPNPQENSSEEWESGGVGPQEGWESGYEEMSSNENGFEEWNSNEQISQEGSNEWTFGEEGSIESSWQSGEWGSQGTSSEEVSQENGGWQSTEVESQQQGSVEIC